ncbi:hypothetical protein F5Y13DRAFT_157162 [Hypoxylon sp. FL1857]|nr:hypothetical protein F5Y13DRAFT_157162 [Hypoxylon sp. FL1857]
MPSPQKPWTLSPVKGSFDGGSRPVSQRSSSKPAPGSVKAIAALFDDSIIDSRSSSPAVLSGWTGDGPKEFSNFLSPYPRSKSPSKSIKSNASLATITPSKISDDSKERFHLAETPRHHRQSVSTHSNFGPASSRNNLENTPTKFPHVTLRPIGNTFLAPRKVPAASPTKQILQRDRELAQPPSLGTMVSPLEEPPVAQHITFMRPSPSMTPLGHDGSDDERASTSSPRPGSSNSVLHYQIRHLQKHLEQKTEENTQLRRQLEARENMDIGKLMEQLRTAKRECKMWRERAEAAEKRVKVFKQFTARVRGLRDSLALAENRQDQPAEGQVDGPSNRSFEPGELGGDGSSSSSEHTENQSEFNDRIRLSVKERATASSHRGVRFEGSGFWDGGGSTLVRKKSFREKSIPESQTAQLWDIAEELLMFDGDAKCEAPGL